MYSLSYSKVVTFYIPDVWAFGQPISYKNEKRILDGFCEKFNTYDECVKRKKELEKISNKQYINFEIVELKKIKDYDCSTSKRKNKTLL